MGWYIAAAGLVLWIWVAIRNQDGEMTRRDAAVVDDSRAATRTVVLFASLMSLIGVVLGMIKASQLGGAWEAAITASAILMVVASWLALHTMFALRYAHLYYGEPIGGIDFPGETRPDYRDFAYLALTVGMTFQVSDTDISSREVRHTITSHAVLSYMFGTVIVSLTINVVAGLIR